ncbi:MAG: phosphoribosylanthranilate isomerase [Bacteroidales bacterium]|nr:phosphoribosylanthranilate isomerase [Bacteroidales bacterium]
MKIKVCGMVEDKNILSVSNLRIDYIGFIFYGRSPRYAGDDLSKSITDRIPEGIKKVGVFVNEEFETIKELVKGYQLDFVQLHGQETPDFCEKISNLGIRVIKAFHVDDKFMWNMLAPYANVVRYFLFDTKTDKAGGSGKKFDWQLLKKYTLDVPFFLSGGIALEDADKLLQLDHPMLRAIDINSRFEISPGNKDAALIEKFIEAIKGKEDIEPEDTSLIF